MKGFYVFFLFVTVGFILFVNNISASFDIFIEIIVAISEPVALLLFGIALIGMATVGRKKVLTKENGLDSPGMQTMTDSLLENDRPDGQYVGKYFSEEFGSK